ncbi:hypothetical protein ACIRIR_32705 [Streptomyces globisporus]|uniref:hypothetical protein n=1 Tax=Streptomyces globisporus TaxID=1908 RepID=UPI0005CB3F9B|nr:hypothetical protein [Streptomyces globisporus]AWL90830.1 hypothetical protein DIJ69_34370 [Streptomyces globisporus]PPA38152.1 hypothetical protein BF14_034455 [Streptomyces griseus]RAN13212.1 hypothetical protein A3838_33575 [Streptomyces badius]WSQ96645.1 hypothetical protein OG425_35135 [Streptomyces globisporus]
MADSTWSKERDDEVPDPRTPDCTGCADQGDIVSNSDGPEEPYHGVTSWLTWIKLGAETILAVVALGSLIYGLVNGNGG